MTQAKPLTYMAWGQALQLDCNPEELFKAEHPVRQPLPPLSDAGLQLTEKEENIQFSRIKYQTE